MQKPFHISTTPTTQETIDDPRRRYRPARCENPNPTGRLPMQPEGDRARSPTQKSFHVCIPSTNRGRITISPGSTPPRTVWNPNQSHLAIRSLAGASNPIQLLAGIQSFGNFWCISTVARVYCWTECLFANPSIGVDGSLSPVTQDGHDATVT